MLRILALAGAVAGVGLVPASAGAVLNDARFPVYDAADGVHLGAPGGPGESVVRFDRTPRASALWRQLSGRRVVFACASVDGERLGGGSLGSTTVRRRRVRVSVSDGDDLCTLSTRRRQKGEDRRRECLPDEENRRLCVRAILPLSDAGRRRVHEVIAGWDLLQMFLAAGFAAEDDRLDRLLAQLEEYLVALPDPSASPPADRIGIWSGARGLAVVVLTPAGERRFVSSLDGVVSTNAQILDFKLPSLL
jgi:hypothetical protein